MKWAPKKKVNQNGIFKVKKIKLKWNVTSKKKNTFENDVTKLEKCNGTKKKDLKKLKWIDIEWHIKKRINENF